MKKVYLSSERTSVPLSGAYEANGFVFISGQIHMNALGQLVGNNTEEKLEAVMSNIRKILEEAELGIEDIIRVHLYLTDLSQLPDLNKAYVNYFKHPFPARTAVGVNALPLGASLEIDVIATRK